MFKPECPFQEGQMYRVKRQISYLNHVLQQGQIVKFNTCAYDPPNGVTRFWFQNIDSEESNAWHVFDNAAPASQTWQDFFETQNE